MGKSSTNCCFVWGTGPVGKGIPRFHLWCLLILPPSLYIMIFFCWFRHCYYHYLALSPRDCIVQSSLIEAADEYGSCFCSLLAHTCQWQCQCWWPRRGRDTVTSPLSSAAATAQEPTAVAKSPAHSYGLQGLQLLQPDLPTCVTPLGNQGCPLITSHFT